MIRLKSQPTPAAEVRLGSLESQRVQAEEDGVELSSSLASGYRHPHVKSALMSETASKCAYCESKIDHVYFGDVEHILPKGTVPERTFEYSNLTVACAICNSKKGQYFDPQQPLLNPYDDQPNDHLLALGMLVWHRPGDTLGERTHLLLALNRQELLERRKEKLESVARLADKVHTQPAGALRDLLEAELTAHADGEEEFSFVVQGYLRALVAA